MNSQAYETSPTDLVSITNATQVFAVYYFNQNYLSGAAVVKHTQQAVYDHIKVVCDRLSGAKLPAAYTVHVKTTLLYFFKLQQANGSIKYAVNLVSQAQFDSSFNIENHWALSGYPAAAENLSFQLWSASHAMRVQLLMDGLDQLENEGSLHFSTTAPKIPQVYVKAGKYKNGRLELQIVNLSGSNSLQLIGSLSRTETSERSSFNHTLSLSGAKNEKVSFECGALFDLGFSLHASEELQDVLYTADGAWGNDYELNGARLQAFEVSNSMMKEPKLLFTRLH